MRHPRPLIRAVFIGALWGSMVVLTLLGSVTASQSRFLFAGTSAAYMMTIASASALLQVFLLLLSGYGLARWQRQGATSWAVVAGAAVLCWGLSGRTVGVLPWPEVTVHTGWFYLPTGRVAMCTQGDCEAARFYTTVEPLPWWRVKIENAHAQHILFIGPLTWHSTLSMLTHQFGPPTRENEYP